MSQFTWPPINTTSGPVQFTKNAVTTTVSLDTVTPANSTPLPVSQLNSSGVVVDPATSTNQLTEITALGTLNTSVNTLLKPASTLAAVTTLGSITNPLPAGTNVIGHVIVDSSGLPTGAATASNQTSGSQKTQVVNSIGTSVDAKLLSVQVAGTDVGLITNSVIRGLTTAGGGTYVDVKVNPSGALSVDASGSTGLVLAAGTAIIGKVSIDQTTPGTTNGVQVNAALPAGANVIGKVSIDQTTPGTTNLVALAANQSVNTAQIAGTATSVGAGPSGNGVQRVVQANASSATTANVSASAISVTLLASSSTRAGATFYNDTSAILYLKFGATASSTSFTVEIAGNGYYELPGPNIYSGVIDGIWSSAVGSCRVTSW